MLFISLHVIEALAENYADAEYGGADMVAGYLMDAILFFSPVVLSVVALVAMTIMFLSWEP
jgi:hypothetical protein